MADARTLLENAAARMHWDEGATLDAICAYVDRQENNPTFAAFLARRMDESEQEDTVETVECKICNKQTSLVQAHLHQGSYIGDNCCWDERLKASE